MPAQPIFPAKNGAPRTPYFDWNMFVRRLSIGAGLNKPKITGHGTRHTFATRWLLAGGSDAVLAKILGHSDTRLIHRVYSHFTSDDLVFALDKVLNKTPQPATKPATISVLPGATP